MLKHKEFLKSFRRIKVYRNIKKGIMQFSLYTKENLLDVYVSYDSLEDKSMIATEIKVFHVDKELEMDQETETFLLEKVEHIFKNYNIQ